MKAYMNATVETMEGSILHGATLLEQDGKILDIGERLDVPSHAEVVDLQGFYVTPGLIDAHTHLGNFTYSTLASMIDGNEKTDPVTPQVRAIDAFYPGDEALEESLSGGVTCVQSLPGSANVIGGTGLIVKLRGHVVDRMVVKSPSVMKATLGENPIRVYGAERKQMPSTRMGVAAVLRQALADASSYSAKMKKGDVTERKLGLEALAPVVRGEMPLSIHCHRADDICTAIRIAEEFDIKYTLEHCTDGHLIADWLAEKKVRAAVGPTLGGKSKLELRHKNWMTPVTLYRSGVHFCIITDHPIMPLAQFTLAATLAMNAGLPRDAAMKALTLWAAEHLGMERRIGSLKAGKDADFAVWIGDPIDARNRCVLTVIDGETVYDQRDAIRA